MSYVHLDGKTLFFHGSKNIHEDKRPPTGPTIRDTEKFGRLKVDQGGKALRLGPMGTASSWWIEFRPGEPEKFRENKERLNFPYLGQQVVPDFVYY
jgi:hypothetical protein